MYTYMNLVFIVSTCLWILVQANAQNLQDSSSNGSSLLAFPESLKAFGGSNHVSKINYEHDEVNRQSFNRDGVTLIQIKNDTEYLDDNNNTLQRVWWYCITPRTEPSEDTPTSWVRTDSIGGINSCIRRCANSKPCSTREDFVNVFNSPLLRCTRGLGEGQCGARETTIRAIRISDKEPVLVDMFFRPSPSPTASPTRSLDLSPSSTPITPTPSNSPYWFASASSIVSQSPTPSPIRKPEDFELDPVEKDPKENARVVGTIIETEVEKAIDEVEETTGADVAVQIKISQRKGLNDSRASESEDDLSMINVARPARYCLPRRNCAVRVILRSNISLRKYLINRAVQVLRKKKQFADVFKNTERSYKIISNGLNTYTVVIKFNDRYLESV